jgi:PiT family inorganic phosphate transporter
LGALLGAVLVGWALGANDAANLFGPAVSTRAISYRTSVITAAICVVLGAWLGGARALGAVGALGAQTVHSALLVSVSAACAMSILLVLRLPASSSQAVVGAIVGVGVARGSGFDAAGLARLASGWLLTPVCAALVSLVLYGILSWIARRRPPRGLVNLDRSIQLLLYVAGAWGAYALGANNAANVTGVFVASGLVTTPVAALIAGVSIALGILTFGRRMVDLMGRDLVQLDPPTALVAMLAQALTVHAFALRGMPVSSSQALAGGVLGIGLAKGVRTIDAGTLLQVLSGWLATPLAAGLLGWLAVHVFGPT